MNNPHDTLKKLQPEKEFFIGIDSDGCAFDTMEIKQKECFCPNLIQTFELQKISKYARETWEFVNLYSKTRGVNRFLALIETFRLLSERPEVTARGMELPDLSLLGGMDDKRRASWEILHWRFSHKKWTIPSSIAPMPGRLKVNQDIGEMVYGMPPFPFVKDSLEKMADRADALVVSQTPVEALEREWKENKIEKYVRLIAGQEYGTKREHLALAAKGKYPDNMILMIGDAPGDFKAAKSNGVLFYPINPGHEEASWELFYKEALDKFFNGTYQGSYENERIRIFDNYLPELPPWK